MTAPATPSDKKRLRAQEAANILRRLDIDPSDPEAQRDRDAFLARGEEERETFGKMSKAFAAAPKGLRNRDLRYSFALLATLLVSGYLAYQPISVAVMADFRSDRTTGTYTLASGDVASLDASSALQDQTDGPARKVRLLRGAAYFDVETDQSVFVVVAGDVQATALGTAFEVSRLGGDVLVSVAKGRVEVKTDDQTLMLQSGEQVRISGSNGITTDVYAGDIADWRGDRMTMDSLTFGEVVSIVERRLPGKVVVLSRTLHREPMAGMIDLSSPENALKTLAITAGADLFQASRAFTILRSK